MYTCINIPFWKKNVLLHSPTPFCFLFTPPPKLVYIWSLYAWSYLSYQRIKTPLHLHFVNAYVPFRILSFHRCRNTDVFAKILFYENIWWKQSTLFFLHETLTPPPPLWTYGWGRIKQKSRLSCTIIRRTKSAICGFIGSRAIVWIPLHIN